MAIAKPFKGQKLLLNTAFTDQIIKLGDASDVGENGGFIVQVVETASLVVSIVVKAQCLEVTREASSDQWLAIKYRGGNVNGTAADWSYVSTAITAPSLIFVPAGSMTAALDIDYTSGTGAIYITPMIGSCAF